MMRSFGTGAPLHRTAIDDASIGQSWETADFTDTVL